MNLDIISAYLEDKRNRVDSALNQYLEPIKQSSILYASISYSLFSGGKRIRPILMIAVYESIKKSIDNSIFIPACALEFVHSYSLIHDDMPCMDNSDLRRGKPTTHKLYGQDIALLAGDALLTQAFSLLSGDAAQSFFSHETICSLVKELSVRSGIEGMVEGQAFEIMQEKQNIQEETIHYIIDHKTSALFSAALKMGGIASGASAETVETLHKIGQYFGQAFQMADDLHDHQVDSKEINMVNLLGKEKTMTLLDLAMKDTFEQINMLPFDAEILRNIILYFQEKEF